MEYRRLGKSGLKLPVVCYGAWAIGGWMWGGTDEAEGIKAIHAAVDAGINLIDTAPMYGFGRSEEIVGKAIKDRRDKVVLATKSGLLWDREQGEFFFHCDDKQPTEEPSRYKVYIYQGPESIREEIELSLERLQTDYIDLYQCHQPDPTTPVEESWDAMLELQKEGKVRAIGVSNFTAEMMEKCLSRGPVASDQPLYNPLERDIEKDILPFCIENNIGVLAYSPMTQGLMTGKVTMDRKFPEDDVRSHKPWFKPENRKRVLEMLKKIQPIADGHKATLAQVTINWVISQKGLTAALVGARNEKQVEENARAADFRLTEDELATIRNAVEELGGPIT